MSTATGGSHKTPDLPDRATATNFEVWRLDPHGWRHNTTMETIAAAKKTLLALEPSNRRVVIIESKRTLLYDSERD